MTRRNQRGEDERYITPLRRVVTLSRCAPLDAGYSFTTRSTHKLVILAFLFVLFGFVVLAQHFTVRVHFNANLLAVLVE